MTRSPCSPRPHEPNSSTPSRCPTFGVDQYLDRLGHESGGVKVADGLCAVGGVRRLEDDQHRSAEGRRDRCDLPRESAVDVGQVRKGSYSGLLLVRPRPALPRNPPAGGCVARWPFLVCAVSFDLRVTPRSSAQLAVCQPLHRWRVGAPTSPGGTAPWFGRSSR